MNGLVARYPSDTMVRSVFNPLVTALRETADNHGTQAMADLDVTRRYERGEFWAFQIMYIRGLLCLKNHQPNEAVEVFRRIVDHRGIYPFAPEWTLAHLGLARAYALQARQTANGALAAQGNQLAADAVSVARARSAYEDFLRLWEDADADTPLLRQARQEYAKLR